LLQAFARFRRALPAVRRRINQLFKVGGKVRSIGASNVAEDWFDLGKDGNLLAVAVIEKILTDRSIIGEGCRHVPIGNDHA
jgi:hypothetical protein